jgi:hypothetical protein
MTNDCVLVLGLSAPHSRQHPVPVGHDPRKSAIIRAFGTTAIALEEAEDDQSDVSHAKP